MFNTSETIKDLEIPEGRRLLHDFFHDRRVKHTFELGTLLDCWKLCRTAREVLFSDGRRVRFETNLGLRLGTRVFFEEIVARYYGNTVQGLVYAGAMIVLVSVGMYLAGFSLWFPLAGFIIEALFLLLMAVVTAYTPSEDARAMTGAAGADGVMTSISNTVRDMTNAVSDLFRLISQSDIRQDVLLTKLTEHITKTQAESTRQYVQALSETNALLRAQAESLQSTLAVLQQQSGLSSQTHGAAAGLRPAADQG